jgi:DNA-binding NtrC family response regulator
MARSKVLIVDDEAGIRFGMRDFLETSGYEIAEAESCHAAREAFRSFQPDAAILDHLLPDGNALDLLQHLKEIDPNVPLVVLTGHGSIDLAVRALKEGAEQFLTKPVELPALAVILKRALEHRRDRKKQLAHASRLSREVIDPFLGTSAPIRVLARQAETVAAADGPVLVQGETGSGKGVLAAWLHARGPRADEAFVDLNCSGLSRELLETELFGHEKGAFTGAVARKVGLLEVAHLGTVFLDEIGDLDAQVQPKLLKVLEEKKFYRLGDVRERRVDVRLIAATHHDLATLVRDGSFRSDLYFRISTIPLRVPPLRERREDIPLLARHLLERSAKDLGRGSIGLSSEALRALQAHSWPGNIRELRNVLERAALLSGRNVLGSEDLLFDLPIQAYRPASDAKLTLLELEREHIDRVLREEGGRVERAAVRLGVPRSSLYQKIKKHGIVLSRV